MWLCRCIAACGCRCCALHRPCVEPARTPAYAFLHPPCSYGALGYEQLYLKESGAPGLLLGVALLVGTCGGELPVFASTAWWLPKLGERLLGVADAFHGCRRLACARAGLPSGAAAACTRSSPLHAGLERAYALGMLGFIGRLALYTVGRGAALAAGTWGVQGGRHACSHSATR